MIGKKSSCVLWFSGLSGAGKTTLSRALAERLRHKGYPVMILDGDAFRMGLCKDLGFSAEDRTENIRRMSEVAAFLVSQGVVVITAFISPYQEHRNLAKEIIGDGFHSIFIQADIETCKARDPKGLYARALAGDIPRFTGISDPFEVPQHAQLVVDTASQNIEQCLDQLEAYFEAQYVEEALSAVQ